MSGLRSLAVVVPLLVFSTCGGGTEPTIELSPAEASALVEVLVEEGLPLGSETRPCSEGGEVAQHAARPRYVLNYVDCRGISGDGVEVTINGEVTASASDSFEALLTGVISSWSGTVSVVVGDSTGPCAIDLVRFNTRRTEGSACGAAVSLYIYPR